MPVFFHTDIYKIKKSHVVSCNKPVIFCAKVNVYIYATALFVFFRCRKRKRGTGYDETSLINNLVYIDDGDDVYARPCC